MLFFGKFSNFNEKNVILNVTIVESGGLGKFVCLCVRERHCYNVAIFQAVASESYDFHGTK